MTFGRAAVEGLESRRLLSKVVGTGLVAEYFAGEDFTTAVLTRRDATVNFNWKGRRVPGSIAGPFSVRWSGTFSPRATGFHSFAVRSNGPVQLTVSGQTLVDNPDDHAVTIDRGGVTLSAGELYNLELEYVGHSTRVNAIRLAAAEPGRRESVVPRARLFPSGAIPAAPSDLTAAATGPKRIELDWTGDSSAVSYTVARSTDGETFTHLGSTTSTGYVDTTASSGETYVYRVTAVNAFGSSPADSPGVAALPDVPANLTAQAVSASRVDLYWDDVDGEDGYRVYRAAGAGGPWAQVFAVGPDVTAVSDIGLNAGADYVYLVEAANASGNSGVSELASARTLPVAPVASAAAAGSGIVLTWNNVAGESGYVVGRSTDGVSFSDVAVRDPDVTGYLDLSLASATRYWYRVAAIGAGGVSVGDDVSRVTRPAVSTLSATPASSGEINLSWSGGSGSSADLAISTDGVNYTPLLTAAPTAGLFVVTGLNAGTPYSFRIVHVNSEGAASDTGAASATTYLETPSGVHTTAVTATDVSLAWTGVAGAADYVIERSSDGTTFADVGSATSTSFNDTGLAGSTQYYYRVIARNGALVSEPDAAPLPVLTGTPPGFLTVSLLGSVRGSGGAFSSTVAVNPGDVVDYVVEIQLGAELTSNAFAGSASTQTIANWIPSNGATSPTAGLQTLMFSLSQDGPAGTIQSDFASAITGTTTGGGTWGAGTGSSNGTPTGRGNGSRDLLSVRLVRPVGSFDGIASDESSELLTIATGSFDVTSGGTQSTVEIDLIGFASNSVIATYRWRNAGNTSNVNFIQTALQQNNSVAAGHPIITFNGLTLTPVS